MSAHGTPGLWGHVGVFPAVAETPIAYRDPRSALPWSVSEIAEAVAAAAGVGAARAAAPAAPAGVGGAE